jgi:hypothetical protein
MRNYLFLIIVAICFTNTSNAERFRDERFAMFSSPFDGHLRWVRQILLPYGPHGELIWVKVENGVPVGVPNIFPWRMEEELIPHRDFRFARHRERELLEGEGLHGFYPEP